MKLAFLHLSDFHIHYNDHISDEKVEKIGVCVNSIGEFDNLFLILTGDYTCSGNLNEYKTFKMFQYKLIKELKKHNGNQYIKEYIVPGNHDLLIPKDARNADDIQAYYEKGIIGEKLHKEISMMEEYFSFSENKNTVRRDTLGCSKIEKIGEEKIQINLINTAPFSTRKPDDKELHYYPESDIQYIKRKEGVSFCITIMHHSTEWFNWECKRTLENTIYDDSEFIFVGHDHIDENKSITINNKNSVWVSFAGEMKVSSTKESDSFNIITIDTGERTFCSYRFEWNVNQKLYEHETIVYNKKMPKHSDIIEPLPSFVSSVKADVAAKKTDFTDYYVFPKLSADYDNIKNGEIETLGDFRKFIDDNPRVMITGATNSGKSLLLKSLFLSLIGEKAPLYLKVERTTKLKPNNFIRHTFEECYGDRVSFDLFLQLDKNKKVLIIDDWDLLKTDDNFLELITDEFETVILSVSSRNSDIIESVKDSLDEKNRFHELHIKPFYKERRNELVRKLCENRDIPEDNIATVITNIDRVVNNNRELFVLNPAFIMKYIDYYINSSSLDYVKGEAVFGEVYRLDLYNSLADIKQGREWVEEMLVVLSQIAGYMYETQNDMLSNEKFNKIIDDYNHDYGVVITQKEVLNIGLESGILSQMDDLSVYFSNKNHLVFFIANYLIMRCGGNILESKGIQYALTNICFGINADIVLFVSFMLNSNQLIDSILSQAKAIVDEWEEVSFDSNNISLLSNSSNVQIEAPTESDEQNYHTQKEMHEERNYSEDVVEARGLFEYDEEDINQLNNKLVRAIRYSEMISRILPSFYNTTKVEQKKQYVDLIYTYPRRIIYALLRPLDTHIDEFCRELKEYAEVKDFRNKNGDCYSEEEIRFIVTNITRNNVLGLMNHFAELCTTPKTIKLLIEKNDLNDSSERIERLLMIENSGNTELLLKEVERLIKSKVDENVKIMAKMIMRKHLLDKRDIPQNLKRSAIDRVFGKKHRKNFIMGPSR